MTIKIKIILILFLIIIVLISYAVMITKKSIKLKAEVKRNIKETKIDEQTKEKIESITTGNINNDFNAGIELLHKLSKK